MPVTPPSPYAWVMHWRPRPGEPCQLCGETAPTIWTDDKTAASCTAAEVRPGGAVDSRTK